MAEELATKKGRKERKISSGEKKGKRKVMARLKEVKITAEIISYTFKEQFAYEEKNVSSFFQIFSSYSN